MKNKKKIYRLIPLLYDLQVEYLLNGCKNSKIVYQIKYKNMDAEFRATIDEFYFLEAFLDHKLQYLHWRKSPHYFISRDPLLIDCIDGCIISLFPKKIDYTSGCVKKYRK